MSNSEPDALKSQNVLKMLTYIIEQIREIRYEMKQVRRALATIEKKVDEWETVDE